MSSDYLLAGIPSGKNAELTDVNKEYDKMIITGNEIWEAVKKDSEFVVPEAYNEVRKVYENLCYVLASQLAVLAQEELTADTFIRAKILVLRLLVQEKWIEKKFSAYGCMGAFTFLETGYEIKKNEAMLGRVLEKMQT